VIRQQSTEQDVQGMIVAAAAHLFGENGYARTGIRDIARCAGVTAMDIETRFRSKEDLAGAVIAAQHRIVTEDGLAVLQQGQSPVDTMVMMCGEYGLRLSNDPVVQAGIRLTFEASSFGYPVDALYEDWIKVLETLASKAYARGELARGVEPQALARLVVACFTGVQLVSEVTTGRADVMARVRQMWEILLPGILNDSTGPRVTRLLALIPAEPAGAGLIR
jgi:AcrR family transcriptional regulator